MMRYIALFLLMPAIAHCQTVPPLQFNHLYCILEPGDLKALSESAFVKDTLCASETRADSKATYLYGPSNYLELFGSSGNDSMVGFSGIAFSVDRIGGLQKLRSILYQANAPPVRTQERESDGKKIPWFDALAVVADSGFHEESRIFMWLMEYRIEYFQQKGYTITDSQLTREHYLDRLGQDRANKLLKKFTGVVLKLDSSEREYLSDFLGKVGYSRSGENVFFAPDNFRFVLQGRPPDDRSVIESIEFEISTHFSERKTFRISDNISVVLTGNDGRLIFN